MKLLLLASGYIRPYPLSGPSRQSPFKHSVLELFLYSTSYRKSSACVYIDKNHVLPIFYSYITFGYSIHTIKVQYALINEYSIPNGYIWLLLSSKSKF